MVRKYREKLQLIDGVQYTGDNASELEEFAPGLIVSENGNISILLNGMPPPFPINVTDWLIDDPYVGYIIPITANQFSARFDASAPQPV